MSKTKFSDLRQGATVYTVHAFDPSCKSVAGEQWAGWITKHFVTGKPYMHTDIGVVVPTMTRNTIWGNWEPDKFFLTTFGVKAPGDKLWPQTNHGCFNSYSAAKRHMDRIASGCMTKVEHERAARYRAMREMMDESDSMYGDQEYEEAAAAYYDEVENAVENAQ